MRKFCIFTALLFAPALLSAQTAEIFGGYSYLRNNSNSFNGWEGQATYNFSHYLGVTGDFDGHYRSSNNLFSFLGFSAGTRQRLYTFLFGPTVTGRFGNNAVFAHALFGGAHSSIGGGVSLPIIGGFSAGLTSATAFAMAYGGGVDFGLGKHFAIRPAEVDYLYTHFSPTDALATGLSTSLNSAHQNSFRYAGGIVVRF